MFSHKTLTPKLLVEIAHWYDDEETQRYVHGRFELHDRLELTRTAPGKQFRGRLVESRYEWVLFEKETPIGSLSVETYEDGAASFLVVVDPEQRGRGFGTKIVEYMENMVELAKIESFEAGVEPTNIASIRVLEKSGFDLSMERDDEVYYSATKDI